MRLVGSACLVLLACTVSGCAEDDLDDALASGACGENGECAPGYTCSASQLCVANAEDAGSDAAAEAGPCSSCPPGSICCNSSCVDRNDPSHCGSCTNVCPGTSCQAGSCTNSCLPGRADCNKNVIDGCEAPSASCPADAGSG
ncbi:MAG: hypothetical protein U0263_29270 [Polyangiaceae bacterium]